MEPLLVINPESKYYLEIVYIINYTSFDCVTVLTKSKNKETFFIREVRNILGTQFTFFDADIPVTEKAIGVEQGRICFLDYQINPKDLILNTKSIKKTNNKLLNYNHY